MAANLEVYNIEVSDTWRFYWWDGTVETPLDTYQSNATTTPLVVDIEIKP